MRLSGLFEDGRVQLADINHRQCQNKQWKRVGRSRVANYNVK